MVVFGMLMIITGLAMMGTGVGAIPGLLVAAAGGYAISLDQRTKGEMQAAEIGDGCLGNMAMLFAIGMVLFLLAMTMTDGQVAVDAADTIHEVRQPIQQYNEQNGGW